MSKPMNYRPDETPINFDDGGPLFDSSCEMLGRAILFAALVVAVVATGLLMWWWP
jgi:hypothetical protein